MGDQDIPDQVRALIAERIDSVVQLEVLLLLHADPVRVWTAAAVAQHLRIDAGWADGQLAELRARGLASADAGGYRYAPATPDLGAAVAALARAYTDRRVTVIGLIFSKPADKLRTFADAFRIRKDSGG